MEMPQLLPADYVPAKKSQPAKFVNVRLRRVQQQTKIFSLFFLQVYLRMVSAARVGRQVMAVLHERSGNQEGNEM